MAEAAPVPAAQDIVSDETGYSIESCRLFGSGQNTYLYLIDTRGGERLVAKVSDSEDAKLDVEGWMLRYLDDYSDLPVPLVHSASPRCLVISYVPSGGTMDYRVREQAAQMVAGLHKVRGPEYGLERDTLIGPFDQPNPWTPSWPDFFREHRLLYMGRAALEDGSIHHGHMKQIEALAADLDKYIDTPAPPSLLHGDIWSGNVLVLPGRISGFIDPAIYYGDPEMELAFIHMLGTFGKDFFSIYNEISQIKPGFSEVRREIYKLYPLLIHARIYGKTYLDSIERILKRFTGASGA